MISTFGLTGPLASGKGVAADIFKSLGFAYFSLSTEVRLEAQAQGLPLEREALQNVGDRLRLEFGNQVLAERVAARINDMRANGEAQMVVIDSLRNPGEITLLQEQLGMYLIGITADPDIRFQRLLGRERPSDPRTREDFDRLEQRDRGIGQADYGNRVEDCLQLADIIFENNNEPIHLENRLRELLISKGVEANLKSGERK